MLQVFVKGKSAKESIEAKLSLVDLAGYERLSRSGGFAFDFARSAIL